MKNSIEEGRVSFVIVGRNGKYVGICRELGFVEEARTSQEVERRLNSSIKLLLETVREHPRLEPSLNTSPPLKYLLLFYWVVFTGTLAKFMYDFVSITTSNRRDFAHA